MLPKRMPEVRTLQRESDQKQPLFSFKATQWIWLGLGIVGLLIGLRIVRKLIAARPESLFAAFIHTISAIFLFSSPKGAPRRRPQKTNANSPYWLRERRALEKQEAAKRTAKAADEMKEALTVWVDDGGTVKLGQTLVTEHYSHNTSG